MVDKELVKKVFSEYISPYDLSDPKIALKAAHTYRVAMLCQDIAMSLSLSKDETELAWLLGMLHDIGRFEQCRVYNTFMDSISVDHALLGATLLFGKNYSESLNSIDTSVLDLKGVPLIRRFIDTDKYDEIIFTAVAYHSAFRIPDELDDITQTMCNILRDADKIDIIRVNIETPLEDIYNVSTKELKEAAITKEVLDSFYAKSCVLRSLKKTAVDNVVGHISLTYELVYPRSLELMKSQGYLTKLMNFRSDNPETMENFENIRRFMNEYLG